MRSMLLLVGSFLAVSLALWNGCLGNRSNAGSEASAAPRRGFSAGRGQVDPGISFRRTLEGLLQSAYHSDLRRPAFPEFRSELERSYARAAWQPLWLRGSLPTEAATRLIARLAAADTLGLESADYDTEWLDEEARELLAQRHTPSPIRLARFDLGLSVAAVRYASALHRGRQGFELGVVTSPATPARDCIGIDRGTKPFAELDVSQTSAGRQS